MFFIMKLIQESSKSTCAQPKLIKLNMALKLMQMRELQCKTYHFALDCPWNTYQTPVSSKKINLTNWETRKSKQLLKGGSKMKKLSAKHKKQPKKPKKRPELEQSKMKMKSWTQKNRKMTKIYLWKSQATPLLKETVVRVRMMICKMAKTTITVLVTCPHPQRWSENWYRLSWMRRRNTEIWRHSMKSFKKKFALWT